MYEGARKALESYEIAIVLRGDRGLELEGIWK